MANNKYEYKTKPFKHQLDALAKSACKKNFAYFMEMGCVDGNTEFLTQRGWVKFKDFSLENWERPLLVAQAIPNANDIRKWSYQFVEPIAYIKKSEYDWIRLTIPFVHRFKHIKPMEVLCTPDHVIPIQYVWNMRCHGHVVPHRESLPDATAEWIHQTYIDNPDRKPLYPVRSVNASFNFYARCADGFRGFESEYFTPDQELANLTDWELRFVIAAMADGTFPNKTNNKVDFYFTKKRKVARLIEIAAKANIPMAYERKTCGRRNKLIHVIHAICPIKAKVFDEKWYSLSYSQLKVVATEIFRWDGWIGPKGCIFYTTEKESADFVQYALMATGNVSKIYFDVKRRLYSVRMYYRDCYHKSMMPEEYVEKHDEVHQKTPSERWTMVKREKNKERTAYCFRVPTGYLLLRRNNRIFISGNSGKTKVMIDNIGVLYNAGHISGALILAPKGVYRNWSDTEIPTHLPDSIEREVIVWDADASPGRKDYFSKQIKSWDGKKLQVLVFNIESLVSDKGKRLIMEFIRKHNGNVFALVDESTCIKNYKAKRTRAAIKIGTKCKVKRIATGSPITNSPLDLYSQCLFLGKDMLGYGSYYAFKNTFADIERIQNRQGQSYEKILRYKNLDILSKKLESFSFRVTKKDCLDLPEKVYMTRSVDLTPEQLKAYKEMRDRQFALIEKDNQLHEMSVQVVLTKMLRLHQILCGTITTDDGECIRLPQKRISTLMECLEETSGKVIIWATYIEDILQISEELSKVYGKDSFVTYYGATSADDRTKAIEKFQDPSSGVRFFLGNVQTAGKGITLTAASTVIYYSNNFSLELRQQSEDRAHRIGQTDKVTYIDLVVPGSLDEKIIRALIEKRNIANEILQDNDVGDWINIKPR